MRVSQIFAIIVSFMLFTLFTLANVLYVEEFPIHDSRGFLILKNSLPNLLGLCRFPLNTQSAGMYGQTDGRTDGRTGRTDELIRVELGNLFCSSR